MKLMDVTIRESVYYGSGIGYEEGLDYLSKLNNYISNEELEYVEICYINNIEKDNLNYNENYINQAYDILKNKYKMVGMMHPEKVDINLWDDKIIKLFSMVRIVCSGNKINKDVKKFIEYFHSLDIEVSINISFALRRSFELNKELYNKYVEYGADYVYFADSSGSALLFDTEELCKILVNNKKNNYTGLHLHDHLGLAFANALIAYKNNIDITDVSITGAGRGGGNLKTEIMIPFLIKNEGKKLEAKTFHNLLNYIKYFNELINREGNVYEQLFLDTLSGIFKLSLNEQMEIEKLSNGDMHKYIDLVYELIGEQK